MCITVHFFSQLKQMVDYLIAFRSIEGSHSGAHLAEAFFDVLNDYGVTDKVRLTTYFSLSCC
jgi:hypothetical protein